MYHSQECFTISMFTDVGKKVSPPRFNVMKEKRALLQELFILNITLKKLINNKCCKGDFYC